MSEWISVNDRMPKYGVMVLVANGKHVMMAFTFRENNSVYWSTEDGIILIDVTHWMPLPEPPKEVGE